MWVMFCEQLWRFVITKGARSTVLYDKPLLVGKKIDEPKLYFIHQLTDAIGDSRFVFFPSVPRLDGTTRQFSNKFYVHLEQFPECLKLNICDFVAGLEFRRDQEIK